VVNFETVYRRITDTWRVYHALTPIGDPDPRVIAHGVGDERALEKAFQEAVRQHRIYNLPIAMRKGTEIVRVSPFDIHLPEDDDPAMPKRVTNGTR
jgi:hypothetical protein